MKRILFFSLMMLCVTALQAAQTLNNPIGADGCYIVKWDCQNNRFATANDFEVDETFTFAIDITGTQYVAWLAQDAARGIATNFGTSSSGNGVARDGDRLFHIQGNIWGKTIKLSQMITAGLNTTIGQQQAIYSNIFGFTPSDWWQDPSDDVVGNSNCFFRTAPYTGTHTCPDFFTNDYAGNIYNWINQGGYAVPCAVDAPCYSSGNTGDTGNTGNTGNTGTVDDVLPGSQLYRFVTDQQQRGYYNRPYERYEAEPNFCTTNGQFLAQSDDQRNLQSEASHQQAVTLNNVGDYVSWVVNKPGDGLTVRFSLPDDAQGQGTDGHLDIYAGTDKVGTLYLNSYWAWQYCTGTYPDNTPRTSGAVIRMRFDENHVRLSRPVAAGEVLKLVKADKSGTPYTIDFAELEPVPAKVTFESLSGNKVQYDGSTTLPIFIANNRGKTIYIPEGTWTCSNRITFGDGSYDNTKIIGAGMWYTQIYFDASSDAKGTYSARGFEAYSSNLLFEGLYLNTVNNKRYYQNNSQYQVGKGFMGTLGYNSVIRNCWVEHFECGAWISDYSNRGNGGLQIEHCRFRNNYADGTNCSHGINNATIRYCSYRNNGDDDMASWTTSSRCENIKYEYCTAENNWRASSLGVFGGKNFTAHHIYIVDALESGARINCDFDGVGFASDGTIDFHDITIEHCACKSGSKGMAGDFWGNAQPALSVAASSRYHIYNPHLRNISVINSRSNAIRTASAGGKYITGLKMNDIYVSGCSYGIFFSNMGSSTGTYCHITIENYTNGLTTNPGFNWTEEAGCSGTNSEGPVTLNPIGTGNDLVEVEETLSDIKKIWMNGQILILRDGVYYNTLGQPIQ